MSDTFVSRLQRAAELGSPSDGIAVLDRHERGTHRSWIQIQEAVSQLAGKLAALGVEPGDRVAIVLPTCTEFIDCFFAVAHLGAVAVPMYPPVRLGRLDEYYARTSRMLDRSGARLLLTDRRIRRILGPVEVAAQLPLGLHAVDDLSAGSETAPHRARPDDLLMVQFSSGTTTHPKPVSLTHRQVLANTEAILKLMPDNSSGVSWLPLYHDMGLIGCIMPAVYRPAPLTLLPPEAFLARPAVWLRTLSRTRATVSPAPNFAYALCTERIRDEELQGCDLSHWRLALNGAEPTSPAVMEAFIERFSAWGLRPEALTPVYGLSEAALAVTFGRASNRFQSTTCEPSALERGEVVAAETGTTLASVGSALPGFGVQIRTPEGEVLPPDRMGQIHVSGPSLMAGYLDDTPSPIAEGWLQTGDLGFVHNDELYVTGRAKDILVIRGKNHAPQDVEQALDTVDGVRTGCAAAVADIGEAGEQLLVFVEHRKDPTEDLTERCRTAIRGATGLDPDLVVALPPGTLPRTSSGKIRRAEALRRWKLEQLHPPAAVTPWFLAGALARSTWTRLRHG